MRDIKFRAWNAATKTMIDLKAITPLALNMDTDGLFIPFSDGIILMQYTGLKDKNGVEIYEGDVCWWKWGAISGNSNVFFCDGGFRFGKYPFELNLLETGELVEVVGNVYENPELLNQTPA